MKKRIMLFIFLITILLILSTLAYIEYEKEKRNSLTGETVTGKVTNANLAVTISVSVGAPSITIIKPANETYFTNKNLPLNFTATGTNTVWYNIDKTGSNTTLTTNISFNTSQGLHTLYLYANNTDGNETSANVTFTVNSSKITIHYNNYSGSTEGSSTRFNSSSFPEIQNLSGIILENTNYGKIIFNEAINLSNDSSPEDSEVNLDNYTNVSSNRIEINSTALPNFNKSATLSLYNLSFSNPRVLLDGSICPETICTEISYSSGTFIFNVTHFSVYTSEETPSGEASPAGPGGGGGSASSASKGTFTTNKDQIIVSLNPGQVKIENLTITNNGKQAIIIEIENQIVDFVARTEKTVTLNPGESKIIEFYVLARIDTPPELYLGKIILKSGSAQKEILIAVGVDSVDALLDVSVEIAEEHRKILPGESLLTQIKLFNLGDPGRKDIFVEYFIKDYEGDEIHIGSESVALETQASFIKEIKVPTILRAGRYMLYARTSYDDKIAIGSDSFEIVSTKITEKEKVYIAIIIILIIGLAAIIYAYLRYRVRHTTVIKKVNVKRIVKKR